MNATGIPFAMPNISKNTIVEDDLRAISNALGKTYYKDNPLEYTDETLYSWTYQGVLLLHSSFTSEFGAKMAHAIYWRNFVRETIRLISEDKKNLVFMLWGDEARYFKDFIDEKKHHILFYEHPSESANLNREWNCNHFVKCNELLQKIGGDENIIYW